MALLIGLSASIVLALRDTVDHERGVLIPAIQALSRFEEGVREQQRGERGYVITNDRSFLEPFEAGTKSAALAEVELRRYLADDPALLRALDEAANAHDRWIHDAAEVEIAAMDRGEPDQAATTVLDVGRDRFESFQAEVDDVDEILTRETAVVEARLMVEEMRLLRLLIGAAVSAMVILGLVLLALERWVIAPVDRLKDAVRRVAEGHLDESVSAVGPREVVVLADDVEAMRMRILTELDEMRRANEALAQQAPLVVGLRDVLRAVVQVPPTLRLDSLFLPAEGVLAGDWFDIWTLDDGRVGMVVADISGHGADAGLFALRLKDLLVSAVGIFSQPGEALGWVADRLGDTGERFATIFLTILEVDRSRMLYANAGHPAVLLAQPETILSLLPTGPLLGPLRARWETRMARLHPDTVLVAYTDGLIEARSAAGEEFGSARLFEVVTRMRGRSPEEVIAACRRELDDFGAGRFQDDVTLVAVALTPPPG
ncbi:MAG TPA: SpoIIE family protein phosphatase [Acidimicrobiales bacterium]|nr:SpoIIE family protein phosphatase [Acidimicrobiales bacterium]